MVKCALCFSAAPSGSDLVRLFLGSKQNKKKKKTSSLFCFFVLFLRAKEKKKNSSSFFFGFVSRLLTDRSDHNKIYEDDDDGSSSVCVSVRVWPVCPALMTRQQTSVFPHFLLVPAPERSTHRTQSNTACTEAQRRQTHTKK